MSVMAAVFSAAPRMKLAAGHFNVVRLSAY
jgi:hypothetical protein